MSRLVVQARVVENRIISGMVKELLLYAPAIASAAKPGQFIHVRVGDTYEPLLRRPLSISDADAQTGKISVIYRIVGRGTAMLAKVETDREVDCMGPLGHGFSLQGEKPLLVGGGMGLAPLVFLAGQLCPKPVRMLMGGRTKQELFWIDVFKNICESIHITTDDGTLGQRGVTLDLLPEILANNKVDMIYSCGPRPMLKGVAEVAAQYRIPCQVSLEDFMACGIGACLSCTCAGQHGKRLKACTDGPVFWAGEVVL